MSKSSNSVSNVYPLRFIQKGLYKSMQTIDHQIQVEITVIMQIVGAQQHMCWYHAASPHSIINIINSPWLDRYNLNLSANYQRFQSD